MTKIMCARSPGFLGPEFNDFLFASIGTDQNGSCLSVVSALARRDLDPWGEAAKLTKLPVEIATQNLSSFVSTLQGIPAARQEPGKIAARLIALLPRHLNANIPTLNAASGITWIEYSHFKMSIFLISVAIMMGFQILIHSDLPSEPTVATHAVISNNPPKIPPSSVR